MLLESLFGNKTIEKVLLFLFVNGKCYGTQLHRLLETPLTPIQNALNRLEKGGIILSYYEGKTRLYQLNPAYPLFSELEHLLKKAYTFLPAGDKKQYYSARDEITLRQGNENSKIQILFSFWDKLGSISQMSFNAKSKSKDRLGWNGKGTGQVSVEKADTLLTFNEKGHWKDGQGNSTTFRNVFRWTLDRNAGMISLEHLRRGPENPVFLFHLAPTSKHSLSSIDSHLCGGDTYFGHIHFDRHSLRLNWRVIGPKKNEEIHYFYS